MADELAKAADDRVCLHALHPWPRFLRCFSDGSADGEHAGAGWAIFGSCSPADEGAAQWELLATGSFRLPSHTHNIFAEVLAAQSALQFLVRFGAIAVGSGLGSLKADLGLPWIVAPQLL